MAHSASDTPLTGTNGTTSAAPIRGCTPLCRVRSISCAARPTPRTAASTTPTGDPAIVTTDRLCAASSVQSSRRTPSTFIAATISATLAASAPSLKLGTHSITESGFRREGMGSLPPTGPNRKLHACVHPGVPVAQRRARDVDRVRANVDGAMRAYKIMRSYTELRGKVPHAGIVVRAVRAVGADKASPGVCRRPSVSRILVVRPHHAAGALHPRRHPARPAKVPAQNRRRNAGAGKRAANLKRSRTGGHLAAGDRNTVLPLRSRRIRLPERKHLHRVLEVSPHHPRPHIPGQHLARVHAGSQKPKAVALLGHPKPALHQHAQLQRPIFLLYGIRPDWQRARKSGV